MLHKFRKNVKASEIFTIKIVFKQFWVVVNSNNLFKSSIKKPFACASRAAKQI